MKYRIKQIGKDVCKYCGQFIEEDLSMLSGYSHLHSISRLDGRKVDWMHQARPDLGRPGLLEVVEASDE